MCEWYPCCHSEAYAVGWLYVFANGCVWCYLQYGLDEQIHRLNRLQGEEGSTSPHHLPKSPTTNREKMRDLSRLHRDHLWTTVLDVCGYIVAQGRGRYKVLAHPCFCEYIGCMLCLCECFFFFVYITPLVNSGDEISLWVHWYDVFEPRS